MLYAPSDFVSVNVSAENHGCGTVHFRPLDEDGNPVKLWTLDCVPCEDFLRKTDSRWATTPVDIAETYDEKLARERSEKAGKMDRERQLAESLIALAPLGQLPAALAQLLQPLLAATPGAIAGQVVCPQGHSQIGGQAFCGACGSPMHGVPQDKAITAAPAAGAKAPAGKLPRFRDARLDEYQALARDRSIDDSGSRSDLLNRLSARGVTAADLQRLRDSTRVAA
jgi:hypothetical protein